MLKITLYKKSILTNSYKQVFALGNDSSGNSIVDHYLSTLNSIQFSIDAVYQELQGTLIFDFTDFIDINGLYEYNYMVVETRNDEDSSIVELKRYCFITNITVKNDVIILEYEEDNWHSYAKGISGANKFYLTNSRMLQYKKPLIAQQQEYLNLDIYNLPTEYKSNDKAELVTIIGETDLSHQRAIIIAEIQYYLTGSQGEITQRRTGYFVVSKNPTATSISSIEFNFTGNEIVKIINDMISLSSSSTIDVDVLGQITTYRYKVGKIYVLPKGFGVQNLLVSPSQINCYLKEHNNKFGFATLQVLYGMTTTETKTIANDFKNKTIGTFNTQIPMANNGTEISISLGVSITEFSFQLLLSLNNQIIDITSDFLIECPIEAIDSEKLSLYQMQRNLKNSELDKKSDILSMEKERVLVTDQPVGILKNLGNALRGGIISAIGGQLNLTGNLLASSNKSAETIERYKLQEKELDNEKILNNAPYYSSSVGISRNSANFVNFYYGICILRIIPDNEEFVKQTINEQGYKVYSYIDKFETLDLNEVDWVLNTKQFNYNYVKVVNISVYGSFTQNIAEKLNNILSSGVKIWYNYLLQEDNN